MALNVDDIVDRRRLRRRLVFWRVAAFLAVAALLILGGLSAAGRLPGRSSPHIARVTVEGFIGDNRERLKMLEEIEKSKAAAVLVVVNSPGGGVTASQDLYEALRRVAAKKPVVAVMGTLAASGGYLTAIGADRIFARDTTITGSIGVIMQYPNVSKLLTSIGVDVEAIKSAPLKAEPSGLTPTSPEARAAMQALISDSFGWFKGLVGTRRSLEGERLDTVTDGRVFTGRQALALGLVDEIGGEEAAVNWLKQQKGIAKDLKVLDWKPDSSSAGGFGFLGGALAGAADGLGLPRLAATLRAVFGPDESPVLDGLLAVWHPRLEN